ncbi:MAG: HigA family addiction module antidote protein [Devosia sp.]|nr:HigA family addiction module antidote protein [Devosia sp.]
MQPAFAACGHCVVGLARKLHIPRTRIERIATEQAPITTNTALRLAKFFDTTPEFWMSMQTAYDLAQESEALVQELAEIERLQVA